MRTMILAAAPLLIAASSVLQIGTFSVAQTTDPINDAVQAGAMIDADGDKLSIGCNKADESNVRIIFDPRPTLRVQDGFYHPLLQIRFGQNKSTYEDWNVEPDFAYIRQKKAVRKFAAQLLTTDRLVFRADGLDGQNIDTVFPVEGAKAALRRVASVCGDKELEAILG